MLTRLGFQISVHLAIVSVLQYEKNPGIIVKVSIQSQDVRMPVRKYYMYKIFFKTVEFINITLNAFGFQFRVLIGAPFHLS